MNLLSAQNISHAFDSLLFEDINLELNSQESIAIIGTSGSGKSTLLNILSTLLSPNEGKVFMFGNETSSLSTKELIQMRRNDIGLIFQSHYLFKGFSTLENLEVSSILSKQTIDYELLKRLDIIEQIEQKVTELSGGQQQRVSIARVLTKRPRIIFADEPTGNLDKITSGVVMDLLFDYIKDTNSAFVLVTHNEELAQKCNKVYRLENKKLHKIKDTK